MKKLYTIAACVGIAFTANTLFAQKNVPGPVLPTSKKISIEQMKQKHNNNAKAQVGEWLFFDDAYFNIISSADIQVGLVNFLFPDSTILTNPADPFATWTHAVGQAYDLTSPAWIFNTDIDFSMPIKIDSILVWGFYQRINNDTDTLKVKLYTPAPTGANLWDTYFFTGATTQTNLGVDTAYFCDITYTQASNTINNPAWSHDIILDAAFFADSVDDGTHQHVIVPTNLTMTLNQDARHRGLFGFTSEFRPGYTHNPNVDVIGVDQNGYRPVSAEFNGTDTYPTVVEKNDLTTGYILPIDVRYNTAGTWNGSMIPMLAYTAPYNWEYIYIVPFISQTNTVSIDENEANANFRIFPNPATDVAYVSFDADFSADAIINVYDLSGKVVKQYNNLNVEQGANSFTLDVTGLSNGAYVTSLISNGQKLTGRLLIAR